METRQRLSFERVHSFLDTLFGDELHVKRVKSLARATLGAIQSASLAVGLIGQRLALARGRLTKHAVKQVDRLLSNRGIDVDALLVHLVAYVVGKRDSITVAMDWTEFDADGQATIMLSLLSRHGRATPLVWLTVDKAALKNHRNGYEYQVLVRLAEILPADVRVRVVADRGFGDRKLYQVLTNELKFDFVIRFRGNIEVTAETYPVGTAVCVRAKGMKQPALVQILYRCDSVGPQATELVHEYRCSVCLKTLFAPEPLRRQGDLSRFGDGSHPHLESRLVLDR